MQKPKIFQKSPIILECEPGTYWWCSCGLSSKQPFCDGSHKGSEFSPKEVKITQKTKIAFCACKNTKNPGFCDGTHKNV